MKIDREQIIRRVAEKHHLLLSDDDPLITLVTMHEVIFESYSEQLIQRMDEQNTRAQMALQTLMANARADQKKDQEKLLQALGSLHQKNLDDYEKVTENCLTSLRNLADEARSSNYSAKVAAKMSAAFGIMFFCANLYLLFRH